MLILSRKIGESIRIGNETKITVLSSSRNKVHLGFELSEDIPVYREEVFERIQDERENRRRS